MFNIVCLYCLFYNELRKLTHQRFQSPLPVVHGDQTGVASRTAVRKARGHHRRRLRDNAVQDNSGRTKSYSNQSKAKSSVLILTGIVGDATLWFCSKNPSSLPSMLASSNYDVWLLEPRGCNNSKKHTSLSAEADPEFWNFSFHEIAVKDLPAAVDFVLATTAKQRLHFVGYSQGSMVGLVGLSEVAELNNKISSYHGVAPVFMLKNMPMDMQLVASLVTSSWFPSNYLLGVEIKPNAMLVYLFWKLVLMVRRWLGDKKPDGVLSNSGVIHLDHYYGANLPYCLTIFSGTSFKNLLHGSQCIKSGETRHFDFGNEKNIKNYGSSAPPRYDITKVEVPSYLYFGSVDNTSKVDDGQYIIDRLPNVKEVVNIEGFDHWDFPFGKRAPAECCSTLVKNLGEHEGVLNNIWNKFNIF